VAGRVYNIDAIFRAFAFPVAGRRGGSDCNAALLFLLHPIHRRGAFMDFADLVRHARVEQYALGRRRLTGINMRHDPDITECIEVLLCHKTVSSFQFRVFRFGVQSSAHC